MIRRIGKWLAVSFAALIILGLAGFWQLYFSARPPLTIESATLAGDGGAVNYCQLPLLNGTGKAAREIPKGNTPGCSYAHFPLPILRECTEPLPADAADLRGLWRGVSGKVGHVERIEQCGARVVVTSSGIIHDSGPNSTGGFTTNDTEGSVLFRVGEREFCGRSSAGMYWNNGILEFKAFGWGPIVVRRYLDGAQLVWEYIDGSVTRMERLCKLPSNHHTPTPRGRRVQLF